MAIFGNIFNELKQVPKDDNANNYEELEAPEDAAGDTTSEEPDTPEDGGYDLEEPEDLPEDDEGDDGGYDLEDPEDLPEDEGDGEEPPPEDEGDGDYELDGEDTGEEDTGGEGEDTGEEPPAEEPEYGGDTELQDKENQLFADMSNTQKSIKDKELTTNFVALYNLVDSIHEKLERVPKTDETIRVIEFTSKKTEEVKMLLQKYISETYSTKTYLENMTNYYQFITVVKKIERGLATIEPKKDDENE